LYSVNVNALFPEMFPTEDQRTSTNVFIKGLTVLGIIFASLPLVLLQPLVPLPTSTPAEIASISGNYIMAGILLACITLISAIPFILRGIHEKRESSEDFEKRPSFVESLKVTLSNKTFVKFTLANLMIWTVFNCLIAILPLYFVFVLGAEKSSIIITLSLVIALVIAALVLPVHKKLIKKYGTRNATMLTMAIWIGLLFPYILLDGPATLILGVIVTALNGFALSGCLMYVDILHSDVIDEDALKFGVRRSASYYGVNALIHRFSTILVITVIAFVFHGAGWSEYKPAAPETVVIGLKLIIFLFPAIALAIGIIILRSFPLHGENLAKMREELKKHPDIK
jgi:GPH family glycoside/pentoside/hexuronide:cation symporter